MKKKLAALIALAMSMTMLASCGDADSSSSKAEESSAPAVEDSSTVEESSEPEASEPESSEPESSEPESSEPDVVEFDGTMYTDGEYAGDWGTPNFVIDADGTTQYFMDMSLFEDYKETGCTVTVEYTLESTLDMSTLESKYYDYYLFGPIFANGWAKIYASGTEEAPFVTGLPEELDARVSKGGELKEDFTGEYFMQSDGFIVLCQDADGNWVDEGTLTFNLTAAAITEMIDNAGLGDDGNPWNGLSFQIYGVNPSSVTISEIAAE